MISQGYKLSLWICSSVIIVLIFLCTSTLCERQRQRGGERQTEWNGTVIPLHSAQHSINNSLLVSPYSRKHAMSNAETALSFMNKNQ